MGTDRDATARRRRRSPRRSCPAWSSASSRPTPRRSSAGPSRGPSSPCRRTSTTASGRPPSPPAGSPGSTVERILNEPTAAAIAYGFHEPAESKTLLVFDLGGGTFDVSVVELFEGTLEVRASAGESGPGRRGLHPHRRRPRARDGRRRSSSGPRPPRRCSCPGSCSSARRPSASSPARTTRGRPRAGRGRASSPAGAADVTVTREQLEAWVGPLLARSSCPIRRVLGDAKLTRDRIDEVILVGGATRMPAVVRRVAELFGKEPHRRLNPDEVVALGAAVQAGLVGQLGAVERPGGHRRGPVHPGRRGRQGVRRRSCATATSTR